MGVIIKGSVMRVIKGDRRLDSSAFRNNGRFGLHGLQALVFRIRV